MLVHFGLDLLKPEWPASVVCIGTFDGVHRGHRALIESAISEAQRIEAPPILVTFDRHPAATLAPNRQPPSIATLEQNVRLFEKLGIAICLILPFDRALADTSAEQFLEEILIRRLRAAELVVGHDFALGHDRVGTPEWLQARFLTHIINPVEVDGIRVSSSQIRQAILSGDVDHANRLLARPFALNGVVVPGKRLGQTIGYPTANLARSTDQIVPALGVYAGYCATCFGVFRAAISVGTNPTVGGVGRTVESFLIDFPQNSLYGTAVELSFLHRIREEQKFDRLEDLVVQMAKDVKIASEITFSA